MSGFPALYDTLVNMDVPAGKAHAVIRAMEADMSATFATKADFRELELRFSHEFDLVHKEFELVRKDIRELERSMIAKLGVMVAGGLTLLFAALQLA